MSAKGAVVFVWVACFLVGCASFPRIRLERGQEVVGPKNAGTPATAEKSEEVTKVGLPAGSSIVVSETPEVPETETRSYRPPTKITEYRFSGETSFEQTVKGLRASTGTVDQRVALRQADISSKQPLLWAAIGCGVGAVALMVLRWPSAAVMAGIASGVFFAAWRVADIPWWAGVAILACAAFLVLGYKRGEWDKNNDGKPDILQ